MVRFTSAILFVFLSSAVVQEAQSQVDARMLRYPDVSATQVTFVYAGDIWVAPKEGGSAVRLSSPAGEETFPRFSPDGSAIAFSGNYDGNTDVYVMQSSGGVPVRVTHHPMNDRVVDWHPDGTRVLFASSRESGKQRFSQFYLAPRDGGIVEKLPVPYGESGALSPDGRTLAYTPRWRDFRTWKRYRGGMNPDVWLFDLQTFESRNITMRPANDAHPMWHGDLVYFLSDAGPEERHNIWAFDRASELLRQVTRFKEDDVRFPAIGPDDIVFENGGKLYLMRLADESIREIEIDVVTDLATLRPRVEDVASLLVDGGISPTGKRAVFEARGEIFTVPAENGVVRNLTQSSGEADRYPSWSPDGKSIAWFSDATGEYELTVRSADGSTPARTVTDLGPGFRYRPYWSPDSRKVAFVDQTMTIRIVEVESGNATRVDQGLWMYQGSLDNFRPSWSPDSRWLAWSRGLDNRHGALFLFDTQEGARHQVTSGYYSDTSPVFDPGGKYLFFSTDRSFTPEYSDLDNSWIYPNATKLAAIPLSKQVASPLLPRNDMESASDSTDDKSADSEDSTTIDLDGFEARTVILPPEAGNYSRLAAADGRLLFLRRPRTGADDSDKSSVVYYDLTEREEKTVLEDSDGFLLSTDGKKILAMKDRGFAIVDVAPGQNMEKPLATSEMSMTVDPRAEWRQLFTDAWRFQRDMFYDKAMHGVDWEGMREHYGSLLEDAVTRWDVDFVIGEMIAELNSSHTYRGGGDKEQAEQRGVGLLGVDWELSEGVYRISRIIDGGAYETEVRSPLSVPGIDVSVGDYVLAVNGRRLDASSDPYAAFVGLADKTVTLTVNDRPTLDGSREVTVQTLADETRLRNLEWIEANRRQVDEASGGRVGYIYVPSTGTDGQNELVRQFMAQIHKDALIIDERFNNGGQIPDRFIELLDRKPLAGWAVRDGKDWQWPPIAHFGPKAMLINGWSGSGGDAFPDYFRKAELGPLIGTSTWGGLIGLTGAPTLIDGGTVTVPTFRMFNPDGTWFAEGVGVPPDIQVIDDPTALARGIDPQIDRAVREMLRALDENPPPMADRPPPEDRSGAEPVIIPPKG